MAARKAQAARVALAAIRLANGSGALLAPSFYARRMGFDPEEHPPAVYVLRLFGVRTVLIGLELLKSDPAARERALAVAPWIHASDTLAAALAGAGGLLPRRAASTAVAVSGTNLLLAVAAGRGRAAGRG
jgi:hypothetical protein